MIPRIISPITQKMASWFPVVAVTGPRQSGKSTLLKSVFPDYTYLNLETRNLRTSAQADPVGFIHSRPAHLFIDEAQYAPDIFAEIQAASDERGEMGQYVLSGSQNFLLLHGIDESLAGRVGLLQLLPLSYAEATQSDPSLSADAFMLRGGYPHLYDVAVPLNIYFQSYISTYIERDVAGIVSPENLEQFRTFLRLCADSAGQLLNVTHLAAEADVAFKTARAWLSLLQSSYIVFLLKPYASNIRKRLTKTPKLYFHDTGLLCHLLGIDTLESLLTSPKRGEVFENLVVEETLKHHLNAARTPDLYFYRDSNDVEVDLMDMTIASAPRLIEVKSGQTARLGFAKNVASVGELLHVPPAQRLVAYRGDEAFQSPNAAFTPITDYLRFE